MLSTITSEENLKEIVIGIYEEAEFKELPDDIKIELVGEEKRDEIYGEFISYSEANHFSNKMEI